MLKKNDVLPVLLALISTAIVVGLGLILLFKIDISNHQDVDNDNVTAKSQSDLQSASSQTAAQEISSSSFSHPGIVPQGTSIRINGSTQMLQINQALKKSFQKQFPGTVVNTNTDGSETGIELLRLGKIDIAAIDRPLSIEEQAAGLVIVTLGSLDPNHKPIANQTRLSYAYQEPASLEVEAFLGHAFSAQGQQAISADNQS
jgi:phosphate transport system substrate-binding protein